MTHTGKKTHSRITELLKLFFLKLNHLLFFGICTNVELYNDADGKSGCDDRKSRIKHNRFSAWQIG